MQKKYIYIVNDASEKILKKYGMHSDDSTIALDAGSELWIAIYKDFSSSGIKWLRVELEFSKEELENSAWLKMRSTWHWEYPQPKSTFKDFTYGRGNYCDECSAKFGQDGPFQIKKDPLWGKRHFLQLNWVYDEIFVKRETYELLVKEKFCSSSHTVVRGGGIEVDNMVQLNIDSILEPGLMNKEAIECVCPSCNTKKYFLRGESQKEYSAEIFKNPDSHIYKTSERFGSPDLHIAAKEIIISNKLYRFLRDNKFDDRLEFQPISWQN